MLVLVRARSVSSRWPSCTVLENAISAPNDEENDEADEQRNSRKENQVVSANLFPALCGDAGCGSG